jgi:hypothetical protein
MVLLTRGNKTAVATCIEIALMMRGNANYNMVLAKLRSLYDCDIAYGIDNLEFLKIVLKEVYGQDYTSVLEDITWELETLEIPEINNFKSEFCKFMVS